MPPGTRKVDRTTRWGNPFRADPDTPEQRVASVERFRQWIVTQPELCAATRRELRGFNLACWCAPSAPCHADILLDIAND